MKDEEYMRLALHLAKIAKGQTSPNPTVGAVVVNHGEIVGVGSHLKAGEAHAEVHALKMAGDKAKGGTIFVTLEPCSHYGKTPPCAEQIIDSGIKRAVIASEDPNPNVAGSGIKLLAEAGIKVESGLCGKESDELNEDFYHYIITKTPYVTLKTAMTLDGKIATSTGESKWITGPEAREDVHRLRHEHDAILVGIGTVLKDDPKLTTRLPEGGKNPIRIILDSKLRTPLHSNIMTDDSAETWLIIGENAKKDRSVYNKRHVKLIEMANTNHLHELMVRLGELGIASLFVEGGATVNNSFLTAKLVNQLIVYMSPTVIGGSDAPTSFEGDGIPYLKDALQLDYKSIEQIGKDLKIVAKPRAERMK